MMLLGGRSPSALLRRTMHRAPLAARSVLSRRRTPLLVAGMGVALLAEKAMWPTRLDGVRHIEQDYELGGDLGSGAFATVKRGKCRRTGKEVAVKVVPKSKQTAESIRHEVEVLRRVSLHTRIASLEDVYETEDQFWIVMEFVGGGDILDYLCEHGAYKEREAATLISELAGAIAILHAQGVAHADIKPENLLLTSDGHVKLVDFGLSAQFEKGTNKRVDPNALDGKTIGTLAYWAPEVLQRGPGLESDLWALGVITYMLLTAAHPFDDDGEATDEKIRDNLLYQEPSFGKYWSSSTSAQHFIEMLLRKDPDRRLTIEQLLQHPWITQFDASGRFGIAPTKAPAMSASAPPAAVPRSAPRGVLFGSLLGPSAEDRRKEAALKAREAEEAAAEAARLEKMRAFREHTARLRAACFSVLVQQQASDRAQELAAPRAADQHRSAKAAASAQAGRKALRRHESMRGPMLEGDMLRRAFRIFDQEGKGYIAIADLQRVLGNFGRGSVGGEWMEGATDGDREGRRITYGSYVRLMTHTVKQALDAGDLIFEQGDPVRYFYCLLAGEVEVVRTDDKGAEEVLNTLHAGEYFGENSLLEGKSSRSVSIRCATPVEFIKLSKDDFDAGFASGGGSTGELSRRSSGVESELRSKLISFIRMVSCQEHRTLQRGEKVFEGGGAADKFYILGDGELGVTDAAAKPLGVITPGEGFGESALLRGEPKHSKTVTCTSAQCDVVEILGDDFLRLVEKSRVVRESFERLHMRRNAQNERVARQK